MRRPMQRGPVFAAWSGKVSAAADERAHDAVVPPVGGHVQRSAVPIAPGVYISTTADEKTSRIDVVVARREMQGGAPAAVPRVDAGAAADSQLYQG